MNGVRVEKKTKQKQKTCEEEKVFVLGAFLCFFFVSLNV